MLGPIIGIVGSMVLTFYRGTEIKIWTFHTTLLHKNQKGHLGSSNLDSGRRWVGVLCGLGSVVSFSSWLIIQVRNLLFQYINE